MAVRFLHLTPGPFPPVCALSEAHPIHFPALSWPVSVPALNPVPGFSLALNRKKESEVAQSCLTLCDPMDSSLPGSTVNGIFQARILEWVAIFFSIKTS